MPIHPSTFETVEPSRYITFTFPISSPHGEHRRRLLRVSVLDSPSAFSDQSTAQIDDSTTTIAATWVPIGRESDWIFTTFSGLHHLMLSSYTSRPLSRLILISDSPPSPNPTSFDCTSRDSFQPDITPLLVALTPKSAFLDSGKVPEIPFLVYEDGIVKGLVLEICKGPSVGDMLIEDVELGDNDTAVREFRRRLRFKRMPNLVQSQMRIFPKNGLVYEPLDKMEFELDDNELVHSYLSPMVAGISVISSFLEAQVRDGFRPKALCLGVGGGALVGFLCKKLDFAVVGVDIDPVVLEVAERHFGLDSNELISLHVGDGIEFLTKIGENGNGDDKFDVIMVDLDPGDASLSICVPPVVFMKNPVLLAAKEVLQEFGVIIINSIPPDEQYHKVMVSDLHKVFEHLYEIDVAQNENFVLIATKSKGNCLVAGGDTFVNKLEACVPRSFIDSIREIPKTGGT